VDMHHLQDGLQILLRKVPDENFAYNFSATNARDT